MKCPYCGIELSDPIAEIHIESKWCIKEKNEKVTGKSIEKILDNWIFMCYNAIC